MGVNAKSSHGTLIDVQLTPGGAFSVLSELGDIDNIGTSRNETDVSVHNEDIDTYILGIMRRTAAGFPVNWVAADPTHQGMLTLHYNNTVTGWRVRHPDGRVLIFSGGIANMGEPAPVDGAIRRNVSIRPSGLFSYNGAIVGQVGTPFVYPT